MMTLDEEKSILRERIKRLRDELSTRGIRKRKTEDREAQLRHDAQERTSELAKVSALVEATGLRLQALKGEEVRFREREYVAFEQAASRVDPKDAITMTMKRLEDLQALVDRSSTAKDLPTYVDVNFNAYSCSFALSRNTTFDSLKEEACIHWGVNQEAVLKNGHDDDWKPQALVQQALAEETRKFGVKPYVRLHLAIASDETAAKRSLSPKAIADNAAERERRIPFAVSQETGVEGIKESGVTFTRDYIRQKEKEAWKAAVMKQSAFFHDSEYITKLEPEMEQTIAPAKQRYFRIRLARSCLWLVFWATTVGLCVAAMIFRFNTATAFSSTLDANEVLGNQPFCVPLGNYSESSNASSIVVLNSACGINSLVRRFGVSEYGRLWYDDESPSTRMLDVREIEAWLQQVLFPALNIGSPSSSDIQRLVSNQTLLMGGKVAIAYASAAPSSCSGFFYKQSSPTCPCFRDYNGGAISATCAAPFEFSSTTMLGNQQGSVRNIYFGQGCTVQTSSGEVFLSPWLVNSLRVILVKFNLLSLNQGSVSQIRPLIEIAPTGLVVTSIITDVLPLSVYSAYVPRYQPLLIISDVFIVLFSNLAVFFWIVRPRLLGMTNDIWKTLGTVWNLIAVLLVLVTWAQIGLGIAYEVTVAKSINIQTQDVQDLSTQTAVFMTYLGLSTLSLFLLILTVFKHLQSDEKTSIIFQTLHRSGRPLGAFLFLLVLAISSMSIWANLAWGPYAGVWLDLRHAVASLAGMLFGAPMNFAQLRDSQNTQLWISFFFVVWVLLVIMIILQFVGAIIFDAFLEIEAVSLERRIKYPQVTFWRKLFASPSAWLESSTSNGKEKRAGKRSNSRWHRLRASLGL